MALDGSGTLRALIEAAAARGFNDGKELLLSELGALASLSKELESRKTYNAPSSTVRPSAHDADRDLKNIAVVVSERFLNVLLLKLNSI